MGTSATIQFGNIISEIPRDGHPPTVMQQIISALSKNNGIVFHENFENVYPGNVYYPKTVPTYVDFTYTIEEDLTITILDYNDQLIYQGSIEDYFTS